MADTTRLLGDRAAHEPELRENFLSLAAQRIRAFLTSVA